ncbi:hypothetical protein LCGC14_0871580 [marine sediment metagenome]|uniref:Transmembrane protein n=1 Tax=marine sediment metagenome TaxID=412755 RepID=A0A0F9P4I3_9ZZZZ
MSDPRPKELIQTEKLMYNGKVEEAFPIIFVNLILMLTRKMMYTVWIPMNSKHSQNYMLEMLPILNLI